MKKKNDNGSRFITEQVSDHIIFIDKLIITIILDTSWIIEGLSDKFKYSFRVSALNAYGWSIPSKESTEFDLNEAARWTEKQNPGNLILIAIGIPLMIAICGLVCILYGMFYVLKS